MAAELAVVVIGGLFASTLLTLLVIPVIYSLVKGRGLPREHLEKLKQWEEEGYDVSEFKDKWLKL
jgi:hypothetical protein